MAAPPSATEAKGRRGLGGAREEAACIPLIYPFTRRPTPLNVEDVRLSYRPLVDPARRLLDMHGIM